MRVLATCRCRQEQKDTAPGARFCLHRFDERSADSFAAVRFVHDERTDLGCGPFVLNRRRCVQVGKADDLVVELRNDDAITNDDQTLEPRRDGLSVRLVAQLAEQCCNRRPVARLGIPNRQTHAE